MDSSAASNGGAPDSWVPRLNEAQQAQLRAQIIIVGSILRNHVIEESLMNLCFADISQGQTLEAAFNEDTNYHRTLWEDKWIALNERLTTRSAPPPPPPPPPVPPKKVAAQLAAAVVPPPKKPTSKPPPAPRHPSKRPISAARSEKELESLAVSVLTRDLTEEKTSASEDATHDSEDEDMSGSEEEAEEEDDEVDVAEQFPEGTSVEVMAIEDGLRNVWFAAKIGSVNGNRVHVIYDDLLVKDNSLERLTETLTYRQSRTLPPRIRLAHPVTSAEVPIKQKPYHVGDHVDKWMNDGWWEGEVTGINSDNKNEVTLYYPGEGDNGRADLTLLRPSLMWKDRVWIPWTAESSPSSAPSKKASSKKKTMSTRSLEVKKKKVEAPPAILNGKRRREKPKWLKDDLEEEEEEEDDDDEDEEDEGEPDQSGARLTRRAKNNNNNSSSHNNDRSKKKKKSVKKSKRR